MVEAVHAKVRNPLNLRRAVLESAISSVKILKGYDAIKSLRQEKRKLESELQTLLDNVNSEMHLLIDKQLPGIKGFKIKEEKHHHEKEIKSEKPESKTEVSERKISNIPKVSKKPVHLDKLDVELESIKAKMNSL
ncbi:hypothetical protein J4403_03690 [Candidatus Woesearchaeota archaeon]|nr:hypothetical protein [uncultured archaeon]MBS3167281.1 hypothetical protein [Candidatus Woesearchaeota archaeon]